MFKGGVDKHRVGSRNNHKWNYSSKFSGFESLKSSTPLSFIRWFSEPSIALYIPQCLKAAVIWLWWFVVKSSQASPSHLVIKIRRSLAEILPFFHFSSRPGPSKSCRYSQKTEKCGRKAAKSHEIPPILSVPYGICSATWLCSATWEFIKCFSTTRCLSTPPIMNYLNFSKYLKMVQ